jgi:asparagine synthetase B (glutamine-hydrolysing)
MTAPASNFSDVITSLESALESAAELAVVNTSPAGAVQSGIDFVALATAFADFGQLSGDVIQVFAQDFEAVISEALAAASLAAGIIADIEAGIAAGKP